jgi:hypothetical protein
MIACYGLCPTSEDMVLVLMIFRSGSGWPLGVALAIWLCSADGPWQVSQLMPGSAQVVRYVSLFES